MKKWDCLLTGTIVLISFTSTVFSENVIVDTNTITLNIATTTAVSAATAEDNATVANSSEPVIEVEGSQLQPRHSVMYNPIKKKQLSGGSVSGASKESMKHSTYSRRDDRRIVAAQEYYAAGKIGEAERIADSILNKDPRNQLALSLKQKIAKVKERIEYAKLNMANEYYYNADSLYKQGQMLNAFLEVKHAMELDPDSKETKALYQDICQYNQDLINQINAHDRRAFQKAVSDFMEGNYAEAGKKFRRLQKNVAQADLYLAITETHLLDAENRSRSDSYFVEAINDMRTGRYSNAQENLFMALEMDRDNVKARLMLEQVDVELMQK